VIVVLVNFDVAPSDREAFVASRAAQVATTLAEAGCLEYALSYDAIDPGRVRLTERWESAEALQAHIDAIQASGGPPGGVEVLGRTMTVVDGEPRG
jgi:quinol monooxygenase YgiN